MARRRPNAFEVSFPEDSAPHEATSLYSEASGLSSNAGPLKRKSAGLGDTREPKRRQLPPTAFYDERGGERESADLVIVGEDEDDEDQEAAKPVRVLSDFAVYDPKHRNEMVVLSAMEEDDGVDREFEAEGVVSPYYANEEDEGQEDDMEADQAPKMVLLSAILRYTFDYTEADGKVYIETQYAWYILDAPSPEYKPLFRHFFTPLRIAQMIISSALKSPRITYDEFLQRFVTKVDPFGTTYQEKHLLDVVSDIGTAVDDCEERDQLKTTPLVRYLLRKFAPAQPRPRRKNAPSTRGKPPPIKALTLKSIDIALLKPENAVPTHVTPFIASLAQGLVTEELVVVGSRPPPENKTLKENQRSAAHERLCELLMRAKREKKRVERIGNDSRYPSEVKIDGMSYKNGDFVIIPREYITSRGNYKAPVNFPDRIEDVDITSTIADYFWFGKIVFCSMNPTPGHFHIHWLQHSSQTMIEELGHPQELFWNDICGNVPWGAVIDKVNVYEDSKPPENFDEYFLKRVYLFVYDSNQATYTSIRHERRELVASSSPPYNCVVCTLQDQENQEKDVHTLRDEKGVVDGFTFHGHKYHYADFVLYLAEEGPAQLGYITGFRIFANSNETSEVHLRRVGRISSIGRVLPDHVIKDERHVFLTEEQTIVSPLKLVCVCHVFPHDTFVSAEHRKNVLALSPYHFYMEFSFPSMNVTSWAHRERVQGRDLVICTPCTRDIIEEVKNIGKFLKEFEQRPLRTLDLFGGVGAFSMGLGEGSGCLQVTDVVELAPSAAKTVIRNFPDVAVHNRCANDVLRYSIKEKAGLKPEHLQQHYDEKITLPLLGKPDVIVAGVPCQSHSRLNQFKKAGDRKSHLILTALSFVDHLKPKFFYFENVPGFKDFAFDAVQAGVRRVEGGIPMGGLKFVVRALTEMQYQVRFGILQAGHYGTPQRRHRFFLIAAAEGQPLPEFPQPSHDFPDNYGLGIRLTVEDKTVNAIRIRNGTAPHPFVSIDDAISDLPRFDWKPPKSLLPGRNGIPIKICDPESAQCGVSRFANYHHDAKTSYQEAARCKATTNLQQFTRTFKPEKVKRVIAIPLAANADYRSLPPELLEWQISNPLSSVGKKRFRPGIYGWLDKDRFFPTTVTNMDTTAKQSRVLNPYCHRMVTVRELARSQGFPDHFVFEALDNGVVTMHRQIGNAVPLPIGVALGRELRKSLFNKWLTSRQDTIMVE